MGEDFYTKLEKEVLHLIAEKMLVRVEDLIEARLLSEADIDELLEIAMRKLAPE